MFDQNPPHTFDKIVEKLITTKNSSQSLTLSLNVKVKAEIKRQMNSGTKNIPNKKISAGGPSVIGVSDPPYRRGSTYLCSWLSGETCHLN